MNNWCGVECSVMSGRRYLERVREVTLEHGWAVSHPVTEEFLRQADAWGFPKYPDRTVILRPDADVTAALEAFIATNTVFLQEHNCSVPGCVRLQATFTST